MLFLILAAPEIASGSIVSRNCFDVFFRVAEEFEEPEGLQEFQTSGLLRKDVLQEVVRVTDRNSDLKIAIKI